MSSSTFNSRRWLLIFFAIVVTVCVVLAAASEWMVRAYVVPQDNFEWIASRLRDSKQPNAAFGDSHVAAVPDFNADDFINLGIGATTIRKMADRVRFYFDKTRPGEVIIQADPHLLAEYRLEARGDYVPESYSNLRLRVFDPRHRGFMQKYWLTLLTKRQLKEGGDAPGYDQLWEAVTNAPTGPGTAAPPSAPAASPTATPAAEAVPTASGPIAASPTKASPTAVTAALHSAPAISPTAVPAGKAVPTTGAPTAASPTEASPTAVAPTGVPPAAVSAAPSEAAEKADEVRLSKFNAFMDYEVTAHTPAANFRERDEARIYGEMIKSLVAQGAKVCLLNYPVDGHYRERADRIPAYADARRFYVEVAEENGIRFVSFWDRFDDPKMYQNTDHVNQNGSPILAREAREACFGRPGF